MMRTHTPTRDLIRAALARGDERILSGGSTSDPDCPASIQACVTRIGQLGPDGVPLAGAANMYVTDALIKMTFDPNVVAGDDITVKNACGSLCADFHGDDVIARWDLTLELCTPDPELVYLLVGGTKIVSAGVTIGYQPPALKAPSNPNGVSIEVWTKAIVGEEMATPNSYYRWAFPRTKWTFDKGRSFENGALQNTFTGRATENPNWEDGPAEDWLWDSTKAWQFVRATAGSLPTAQCGAQALSAS